MKQPKKKTRKKRDSLDTLYDKRDRALERGFRFLQPRDD
jgi:hypothetical protein